MKTTGHVHSTRPRLQNNKTTAAMAARIEDTSIPENATALMPAPPVENRAAAAMARTRGLSTRPTRHAPVQPLLPCFAR